jgi:actin-like ATPase involved in cell morphogenesis
MSVSLAEDPLGCVALGAGAMLEELDALSSRARRR